MFDLLGIQSLLEGRIPRLFLHYYIMDLLLLDKPGCLRWKLLRAAARYEPCKEIGGGIDEMQPSLPALLRAQVDVEGSICFHVAGSLV